MEKVKDIKWNEGMKVSDLNEKMGNIGFQATELKKATDIIVEMKRNNAKIYLTFTSNMVTSGLRGLFAQMIKLGIADVVMTTTGGIEEDIMKATGEDFLIGAYRSDDVTLHEKGKNRIGNLLITNESYAKFEDYMLPILKNIYDKKKRLTVTELLHEIGMILDDEDSILYQAARNNVPVFCPAITDGSLGFHLYMFQQSYPDFMVDVIKDFSTLLGSSSYDDKKGVIALGGGVSKHHAIFGLLLNGGSDYAVYMTTSRSYSGSVGGATTSESKTWGKVKIDANETMVIGDVSITFPLVIMRVMDMMKKEGMIKDE
jgi:deoxyhypusine synthase